MRRRGLCRRRRGGTGCLRANCSLGVGWRRKGGLSRREPTAFVPAVIGRIPSAGSHPSLPEHVEASENLPLRACLTGASGRIEIVLHARASRHRRQWRRCGGAARGFWRCWSGHDPGSERRAGVAGDRPHRYAQGVCEPVVAGAGGAAARSAERSSVLLPRTQRRSFEGDLARRPGRVPVHEAAGAGPLLVADRWPTAR